MEKIKQSIVPALIGVVIGMLLMTFGFGFVSGGTATEMAEQAAQDASVAALVPICVANAQADPDTMATVLAMSSYQRRTGVANAGWATYPDGASTTLKRAIDQGCVDGLS